MEINTNNIENNNNNNINNLEIDEIKNIINSKETEIKNILLQKVTILQNELNQKNIQIENNNSTIQKLKSAYSQNLELINERDKDLKIYEEKFDNINEIINEKNLEI